MCELESRFERKELKPTFKLILTFEIWNFGAKLSMKKNAKILLTDNY